MQLTLVDSGDLKHISKALRNHADGKRLRKELVAEMKEAANPLVPQIKAAWLAVPSSSQKPKLRQALAKATRVQVRLTGKEAGVRVRTDGRKMPSGSRALPGYAEGIRRRPWRHPVFGNREVWVTQQPFPRFYDAAKLDEVTMRRRCNAAVDKVFDQIERA
jgi:hypothetical protein